MNESSNYRQYIFVIKQLIKRELKRKYSRSYLGIIWSVLNPLLSMAVMSVIFSSMFKRNIEYYPLYLLTGTMLWQLFTTATNTAMTSVVDNKAMLMKIKFSQSIFPLSRIFTAVVNFGYTLVAFVVMFLIFGAPITYHIIFAPVVIFFLILFTIGFGYILATLFVFFGDIKHLYSVVLTLWMYCSAIFYPVENVPEMMQKVILNNPIYNYIACMRKCTLYSEMCTPREWILMILWGFGIYVIGRTVFRRNQNNIIQAL